MKLDKLIVKLLPSSTRIELQLRVEIRIIFKKLSTHHHPPPGLVVNSNYNVN